MSSPYRPAEIYSNPYPTYDYLRQQDPVHYHPELKFWVLTRYQDCVTLFRDPRAIAGGARIQGMFTGLPEATQEKVEAFKKHLEGWALFSDPPAHTRIRTLMNKSLTAAVVEELRPSIVEITNALIDELLKKQEVDLITDFANSLPVIVIGALLGMPASDRVLLKSWSDDLAAFIADPRRAAPEAERANRAFRELHDYISKLIAARRQHRERDIVSNLVNAEENGSLLNDEEIISTVSVILFGGHETTTNLIGNGFLALFQNSDEWTRLKQNHTLIPSAVEEFLRFDSPVQFMGRSSHQDLEIGGKKLPAGSRILACFGAANRDPQQFPNPNQLDLARRDNRHLAFGIGSHFCVGAQLARAEAQIVFRLFLERCPNLRMLPQELKWRPDLGLRGLRSLRAAL